MFTAMHRCSCLIFIWTLIILTVKCDYNNFEKCDYFEVMKIGETYDVFSPNFPNNYLPGTWCRWSGCAPSGTHIVINCSVVQIPTYTGCDVNGDRLEVSLRGCQELNDANNHCTQPFITNTMSNALVMALKTIPDPNSPGGAFFCRVTAQPSPLPAAQPVSPYKYGPINPFPRQPSFISPYNVQQPQQSFQPIYPPTYESTFQSNYQRTNWQQQSNYPQQIYRPVPSYQPSFRPSYQSSFQQTSSNVYPGTSNTYPGSSNVYPGTSNVYPGRSNVYPGTSNVYPGRSNVYPASAVYPGTSNVYPASGIYPPPPVYSGSAGIAEIQGGYRMGQRQNYPVVSSYTPTQSVYHPMTPQNQPQCECGQRKRLRLVNGENIDIEHMPFTCGLIDLNTKTVFCGCTIISQYFVLTAAHCLTNRTIDTIGCVVGTTNYARAAESQFAATYQLLATEIYAGYDSVSMLNDIAIARVGPMEFNPAVSAVCLPISPRLAQPPYTYSQVVVSGYGESSYGGPPSPHLQIVTLDVISKEQCNENYPYQVTDSQICTLTPGKDTCTLDDGTGFCHVDTLTGRLVLIGIPSYGVGCGTRLPRVGTRVSNYIPWIQQVTKETFCTI